MNENAFGIRRYLKVQEASLFTSSPNGPTTIITLSSHSPIQRLKPTRRNILTQPEVQITGSLTFISNFQSTHRAQKLKG